MTSLADNRNVRRALAIIERDLGLAAIEFHTYGTHRAHLETLQAAHGDFVKRMYQKPELVRVPGQHASRDLVAA